MSKNNCKKIAGRKKPAPINKSPLEIRRGKPGESFYLTGNTACHQCLVVREHVDIGCVIGQQFWPVADGVSNALNGWIQLVLFHEAVTDSGKTFACPQILPNGLNDTDWESSGRESTLMPAWHWLDLMRRESGEVICEIGPALINDTGFFPHAEFLLAVSVALAPKAINTPDHPMVIRLRSLYSDEPVESGERAEAPIEW